MLPNIDDAIKYVWTQAAVKVVIKGNEAEIILFVDQQFGHLEKLPLISDPNTNMVAYFDSAHNMVCGYQSVALSDRNPNCSARGVSISNSKYAIEILKCQYKRI